VAYAVPSNPTIEVDDLISFYDGSASQYWQNFTNSLQQVACNTTTSAQYSLVKTCNDCTAAYKSWLCAALIPRCQDLSVTPSPAAYTIPRNVAADFVNGATPDLTEFGLDDNAKHITWYNSSRNAEIDTKVAPGPYRELLPCRDLCYELVRSCPASMGFACPQLSQGALFNSSYGVFDMNNIMNESTWTCSYPGIDPQYMSAAGKVTMGVAMWAAMVFAHLLTNVL
jgi:calcium channel MID1